MSLSTEKPLFWLGSSKKDLLTLPIPVRKFFGHALDVVFVLHAFQKKSKHGIETPKTDMEIIRQRLKIAAILTQEWNNE